MQLHFFEHMHCTSDSKMSKRKSPVVVETESFVEDFSLESEPERRKRRKIASKINSSFLREEQFIADMKYSELSSYNKAGKK